MCWNYMYSFGITFQLLWFSLSVIKGWLFSSHKWMWELDHKEGWALKNQCFWTVVLEKTLESPLDCKEIKPASPKGEVKVAQSCPALCDPMDYTVLGILQARILEWVAFPFSKGSSQPRDGTQISLMAGRFLTGWAAREALKKINPE